MLSPARPDGRGGGVMQRAARGLAAGLAVLGAVAATSRAADPALEASRAWHEGNGGRILREFVELLSIPNVASDDENIRRNAAWIAGALERRGGTVELLEQPGAPPVVYAELIVPGARRTWVLYAHYDGQPVTPEEWTTDPWTPTLYTAMPAEGGRPIPLPAPGESFDSEWRLLGRSVSDDKAPIQALLSALDALRAAEIPLTVNLKVFLDGEEEAGSPHLREFVEAHRERLGGDAWLFLDGPVHQTGRPQLFFGARGIATMEVTVYGATRYLHSGHYGNFAQNPNDLLTRLLASFKDQDGRVRVEGYYDSIVPLGETEKRALDGAPAMEEGLLRELGLARALGRPGARYLDGLLFPSLNVRGLYGGATGDRASNVIPTRATASLDLRLVKGNDPEAMMDRVEAHIRRQGFHIVRDEPDLETRLAHPRIARVERQRGYPAVRTPMDLPVAGEVIEAARLAAGGDVVLLPTLGGSLPLYVFEEILGAPLIGVPTVNADNNQHGADENLRLGNLAYAIDLLSVLLGSDVTGVTAEIPRRRKSLPY
jgi:acetylornithine deacetylase/succinyl-diaminopimelate desuccinylase-like protein